jgi:hypothetical protein
MARITFTRMWYLIQQNYSTYFGRYKSVFTPELMAAIFFEETKFANITQQKGGPAVGFGQVERTTIPSVNDWFGTTFDNNGSDVLHNDAQSVQLSGLTLAMLYEKQLQAKNTLTPRDAALLNYAGYPINQDKPPCWVQCDEALLKLKLPDQLPELSRAQAREIKSALKLALLPRNRPPPGPEEELLFFPAFPTLVGRWHVQVGDWRWIYQFYESGDAHWYNTSRTKSGSGTWRRCHGHRMHIERESGAVEHWETPLQLKHQRGTLLGQGRIIDATKQLR